METKKSKKANLEKTKTLFFIIGIGIVFALVNYAFNIQSKNTENNITGYNPVIDELIIPITRPPNKKPKPQEKKHFITDIINIVENPAEIDTTIEFIIPDYDDDPNLYSVEEEPISDPVYNPNIMPEFPGGVSALQKYIAVHTDYPEDAKRNDIQGTVFLRFEVTKTGTIGKVVVLNENADILLKNEALRVVKTLPKFKPGVQNGKPVNVWYSIPVSFKLY